MKIAAAYIRVSTDDQIELSPDSQIKQIREFAKRNDMIVPDEYVFTDEGISGKGTTKRAAFNAMIGTAKTKPKPFECILVWKFSRFARNREDSIVFKSMLRKQLGIDVVSISENIGDDKMSILIEALIEAMDEYYSLNLAEEVTRGMTEKVSRGGCVSGPALGYDVVNKMYVINSETAPIVQMIYDDYLNGMGHRDIAVKLNDMGVKTSRGGLWENRTVEYILKNTLYIGKIHWCPTGRVRRNYDKEVITVEGKHDPIISAELFNAVQLKLQRNKRTTPKNSHPAPPSDWMLRGVLKCSNCGSTLSRVNHTSVQCHQYAKGKCQVSHSSTIEQLNCAVIEIIELSLTTGDFNLKIVDNTKVNDEMNLLLQREYDKLNRVKQAYQAGIDTLEEYKTNKMKIEDSVKYINAKIPNNHKSDNQIKKDFIDNHLLTLKKLKSDISQGEKNQLIKGFVDKIIFYRATNSVRIFYKN